MVLLIRGIDHKRSYSERQMRIYFLLVLNLVVINTFKGFNGVISCETIKEK